MVSVIRPETADKNLGDDAGRVGRPGAKVPQVAGCSTTAVRLATADEIANSVSVQEIARQYKTTIRMVYKMACLHQWRRVRKGRSIYYDVVEVARTLGE